MNIQLNASGRASDLPGPRITLSASYNAERNRIVIELSGGMELAFDPAAAEGLARARSRHLL